MPGFPAYAAIVDENLNGGASETNAVKIIPADYENVNAEIICLNLMGGFFILEDDFLTNQVIFVEENSTLIIPEEKSVSINNTVYTSGVPAISINNNKSLVIKGGGTLSLTGSGSTQPAIGSNYTQTNAGITISGVTLNLTANKFGFQNLGSVTIQDNAIVSLTANSTPTMFKDVSTVSKVNCTIDGTSYNENGVESWKIAFDANGGSGTMTPQYVTKSITTAVEIKTNSFTPPSQDKNFAGWSTTTNGEAVSHIKPTSDMTLYAIWTDEAPTYSASASIIWYDSNDTDGLRPGSVTASIAGVDYILYETGNWTVTVNGLDSNDYSWTLATPENYTLTTLIDGTATTFVLRHTPAFVFPEGSDTVRKYAIVWQEGTTDNDETRIGYVGGDTSKAITFTRWNDSTSMPSTAGNYYLATNVKISVENSRYHYYWEVGNGVTNLNLNGHSICENNSDIFSTIELSANVDTVLNIYDVNGNNGIIKTITAYNMGIKICNGTVNMYGGKVCDTEAAILVSANCTFNMYDGEILENKNDKPNTGAGVDVDGIFNMYGGKISDNISVGGCGVNVTGTFNMYDGEISGNKSTFEENGGGVGMR